MSDNREWKQFEKTGNIFDYLNYTACTCESSMNGQTKLYNENKEGDNNIRHNCNRDNSVFHAYGRVR